MLFRGALKPDGVLAMNYQDFDHWIRRVLPRLKVGWNVMFNQTGRPVDFLLQKLTLTLLYRGLECQTVPMDTPFVPCACRFQSCCDTES
jgi:hypothetical protein